MSGHSKWANIRRKKEAMDAARGKIFTRLAREITIAARLGGGDESANPRLRTAILAARAANMPAANIERAIKRGTGELEGVAYEDFMYEAYGPGGVALIIEGVTDNKNRTLAEIRHLLSRHGGNLATSGAVSWMFETRGVIQIPSNGLDEDTVLEAALEAGAEDFSNEGDYFEILTAPNELNQVQEKLAALGYHIELAQVQKIPKNYTDLDPKDVPRVLKLLEVLDEQDDVQKVSANVNFTDEMLAGYSS